MPAPFPLPLPLPRRRHQADPLSLSPSHSHQDLHQYFTSTASAGLASLYTLIHASLRHASLDDPADVEAGERQKYLEAFEMQWEKWVRWVVEEYGGREGAERKNKVAKVDGEGKIGDGKGEERFFWQY